MSVNQDSSSDSDQFHDDGKKGALTPANGYVKQGNINADAVPHTYSVDPTKHSKPGQHTEVVVERLNTSQADYVQLGDPFHSHSNYTSPAQSHVSLDSSTVPAEGRKASLGDNDNALNNIPESEARDLGFTDKTPPPRSKYETYIENEIPVKQPDHTVLAPPHVPNQRQNRRAQVLFRQGPKARCIKCAKVVRFAYCWFSLFFVIGSIVVIALWPTVIGKTSSHQPQYTTVKGSIMVTPQSRLKYGGASLTVETSDNDLKANEFVVKAYYGPSPNETYTKRNTTYFIPGIPANSSEDGSCKFNPFIFDMGSISGSMRFTVFLTSVSPNMSPPTNIDMDVYVYTKYEALMTRGNIDCNRTDTDSCVCWKSNNTKLGSVGSVTYTYTAEEDSCNVKTSMFGNQRYFLVLLSNNSIQNAYTADLRIEGTTSDTLDLTHFSDMKHCNNSSAIAKTSFTCDLPYGFFFSEIFQKNQIFLHTHYPDCDNCYGTFVTVTSTDVFRSDFIVMVSVLVLVVILIVVVAYKHEDIRRMSRNTRRFCWQRVARRTYQALM